MEGCAQHFLPGSAMEKSCSSHSAKRNGAQISALAFQAPNACSEGGWLQAFWGVTVQKECSVLKSAAVSSVGLVWDGRHQGNFASKNLSECIAKLMSRINNQGTSDCFCQLTSASEFTESTRKNSHPSSALHCILALYW